MISFNSFTLQKASAQSIPHSLTRKVLKTSSHGLLQCTNLIINIGSNVFGKLLLWQDTNEGLAHLLNASAKQFSLKKYLEEASSPTQIKLTSIFLDKFLAKRTLPLSKNFLKQRVLRSLETPAELPTWQFIALSRLYRNTISQRMTEHLLGLILQSFAEGARAIHELENSHLRIEPEDPLLLRNQLLARLDIHVSFEDYKRSAKKEIYRNAKTFVSNLDIFGNSYFFFSWLGNKLVNGLTHILLYLFTSDVFDAVQETNTHLIRLLQDANLPSFFHIDFSTKDLKKLDAYMDVLFWFCLQKITTGLYKGTKPKSKDIDTEWKGFIDTFESMITYTFSHASSRMNIISNLITKAAYFTTFYPLKSYMENIRPSRLITHTFVERLRNAPRR